MRQQLEAWGMDDTSSWEWLAALVGMVWSGCCLAHLVWSGRCLAHFHQCIQYSQSTQSVSRLMQICWCGYGDGSITNDLITVTCMAHRWPWNRAFSSHRIGCHQTRPPICIKSCPPLKVPRITSRCASCLSRFDLIGLPFSFLFPSLMTHSHLHSYSVLSRLLMRRHPMQTFISDSFLVISDSSYDSSEP